jgi:hypothetical protein
VKKSLLIVSLCNLLISESAFGMFKFVLGQPDKYKRLPISPKQNIDPTRRKHFVVAGRNLKYLYHTNKNEQKLLAPTVPLSRDIKQLDNVSKSKSDYILNKGGFYTNNPNAEIERILCHYKDDATMVDYACNLLEKLPEYGDFRKQAIAAIVESNIWKSNDYCEKYIMQDLLMTLGVASRVGSVDVIKKVFQKLPDDAYHGSLLAYTCLIDACKSKRVEAVKELYTKITHSDVIDHAKSSELLLAALKSPWEKKNDIHLPAIVQEILNHSGSIHGCDEQGLTFLAAATMNHAPVIEMLIDHCWANPNEHVTLRGMRVHMDACSFPSSEETALHLAVDKGNTDTVETLLRCGANPDVSNSSHVTPLQVAANRGDAAIVEKLLKHGAHPDFSPHENEKYAYKTPLMFAADGNNRNSTKNDGIVNLLLQHKANIHAVDDWGYTALHHAATGYEPNLKTIKLLLDAGANPVAKSRYGATPIKLAKTFELKKLLIKQQLINSVKSFWQKL